MIVRRFFYFLGKAWQAISHAPGLSALTAATICASLCMLGLYAMAMQNVEGLARVWGRAGNISCYLSDAVLPAHYEKARRTLSELPGAERAVLVTPHEALERFRARGSEAAALVEGVPDDVLPAAVEVYLLGGFSDLAAVADVARQAAALQGVEAVDFGEGEFAALRALLGLLHYGGWLFGGLLVAATALIVANTIRLVVYAQRDEIGILRLVGATQGFICAPFLLEGAFWGACGGTLGAASLWLLDHALAPRLSQAVAEMTGGLAIRLFAPHVGVLLVGAGTLLGIVGSGLAVRRFLAGNFDEASP